MLARRSDMGQHKICIAGASCTEICIMSKRISLRVETDQT